MRVGTVQEGVAAGPPDAAESEMQLRRLLASRGFARSPQLRRLLEFIVRETLAGRGSRLKEYALGREVFERGADFDPRSDPIVRIDARRLRARLSTYYAREGADDPVAIELLKGGYVPMFRRRPARAPSPGRHSTIRASRDVQAYELYLRGRHHLQSANPATLDRAMGYLEAAVARDPQYASALLALADGHVMLALFVLAPPRVALAQAAALARRALAADPGLAAAQARMAAVSVLLDHDFAAADAGFARAIALDPTDADVRHDRAQWLLAPAGRLAEAHGDMEALLATRPTSLRLRTDMARMQLLRRRYGEAIGQLQMVVDMEPGFGIAWFFLAMAHELSGDTTSARAAHGHHVALLNYPLTDTWLEAYDALMAGRRKRALAIVADMARDPAAKAAPTVLADMHRRLDQPEQALTWLQRAVDSRVCDMAYLDVDPRYDALRHLAGFAALRRRIGLPATATV